MAKRLWFYFGTVIFFIGVLMIALGFSKTIGGIVDLITIVELVSGIALIIAGSRAIRSPKS